MLHKKMQFELTICAAALVLAFPAAADEQAVKDDGAKADSGIAEVIVTASKRKESIQSVTMSVDAISEQTILKQNIQKFDELEKLSPGLALNAADGRGQNVSLRGVTFNPDTGTTPAVQIYWNETPISTSDAFRGVFDLSRVEILRGPQGTLRGLTSPAGSITMATARPDLDVVSGRLIQSLGSRNMRNTQAAVSVPLIEGKLGIRIAGLSNYSETGVHNYFNGINNRDAGQGGRASLLYQPTRDIEVLLVHQQLTSKGFNFPLLIGAPVPQQGKLPVLQRDDLTALTEGGYQFYNKHRLTSLSASWAIADHKLSYIGGSQRSVDASVRDADKTDVIPNFFQNQVLNGTSKQTTHEARIESTGQGRWNYMLGAYYSRNESLFIVTQPISAFYPGAYLPPVTVAMRSYPAPGVYQKSKAIFTDHRIEITENDQVQLGYRIQESNSYEQRYLNVGGRISAGLPEAEAYLNQKARTASASYRHNFTKQIMSYVSYADGYRPGGIVPFVSVAGLNPEVIKYKEEKTRSLELGVKATLFERKVVLNSSIFQQRISNYISRAGEIAARPAAVAGEPNGPGPGGTYPTANTIGINTNGDALARGVEFTGIWSIRPNWRSQLGVSYTDAHYDNALLYCNDSNNDGIPDNKGTFVQPGKQISQCRSNRPLADKNGSEPGKLSASLQSEYSHSLGKYDGFVRGLVRYTPPSYNLALDHRNPSFTPVDVYLGVRDPSQSWEISVWAQNAFDRSADVALETIYQGGQAGGYRLASLPQERKVGVTLRYDFSK